MKRAAILLAFVVACTSPEEAAVEAGAKAPVYCLREDDHSKMHFCRDSVGGVYFCSTGGLSRCAAAHRARRALFSAEAPQ